MPTETKPKGASAPESDAPATDGDGATPDTPEPGEALSEPQGEPDLNNLNAYDGRTIHERMVTVIDELPALGKDQENTQQNFMFRGHDQILNALNPLLAKHGIVVVPNVLERVVAHRTTGNNKTMYEVNLHVQYAFWGSKGDVLIASVWGEGTDMGDKATSKAMTMAFKSALNQAFAISSEEFKDADAGTPQETTSSSAAAAQEAQKQKLDIERRQARRDRISKLAVDLDKQISAEPGAWMGLIEQESQRVFGVAFADLDIRELEDVGKTVKAQADAKPSKLPEQLDITIPF